MQKNEVGVLSLSIYKINSKWIKELNSRAKAIELLEENTEVNIFESGLGSGLLNMTLKAQVANE